MTGLEPTGGTIASASRGAGRAQLARRQPSLGTRTIPDHEYALAGRTTYACCTRCSSISQVPHARRV